MSSISSVIIDYSRPGNYDLVWVVIGAVMIGFLILDMWINRRNHG